MIFPYFVFNTMNVLTQLKFAHWVTKNQNQHDVYEQLRVSLSDSLDKLVESILSTNADELDTMTNISTSIEPHAIHDIIIEFLEELNSVEKDLPTFLVSIINEMQLAVRKALYLLEMI